MAHEQLDGTAGSTRRIIDTIAKTSVLILAGVLIITAFVAVFVRFIFTEERALDFETSSRLPVAAAQERVPGAFDTLEGKVHLSLVEVDDWPIRPYVLDPNSGTLERLWPRLRGAVRTPARSLVDPELSIVSAYPDDEPGDDGYTFQLFLVDTRTALALRQLTIDAAASKRIPQWSPDGTRVTYHALTVPANEIPATDTSDPDAWSVYVTEIATGLTREIASGAMPLWSADGMELIYLNARGMASYDFRTDESFQVFMFENVTYRDKIGINRAGDRVAWTSPNGTIRLYRIGADGFLSPELVREIDTGIVDTYWPVFSPDGRYLTVQAIERSGDWPRLPRVVMIDLEHDVVAKVADLSGFNFLEAYTSDWTLN